MQVPPRVISTSGARDLEVDAVRAALAEVDTELRAEFPDLFVDVDKLLARRGRSSQELLPFATTRPVLECAWCGDDFVVLGRPTDCCSRECGRELYRFRHTVECAWCGDSFVATHDSTCCSRTCAFALQKWRARRSARQGDPMPDPLEVKPHGAEPDNERPQPVVVIDDAHLDALDEAARKASE